MTKKITFQGTIIYEDADYFVINKPPFVSTLEDRNDSQNILSMARRHHTDVQICHRLDKNTSGALVIAKNNMAYRHMSMQFENREVDKVYHAVADGIHDMKNVAVAKNILKLANGTVRIDRKGKEANTIFNTKKVYKSHTLIECRPVSGRMHQIRIHLAYCGASISGDTLYGGRPFFLSMIKKRFNLKKDSAEQPLVKRQALHAFKITFKNTKGHNISVEAPYPKDFRVLVEQLEKNS